LGEGSTSGAPTDIYFRLSFEPCRKSIWNPRSKQILEFRV
jgi:hypothetical protein